MIGRRISGIHEGSDETELSGRLSHDSTAVSRTDTKQKARHLIHLLLPQIHIILDLDYPCCPKPGV